MSPDVLISFAHGSTLQYARALRNALDDAGIHAFLDERSIPPGSEFPSEIADALLKSRLILVLADRSYFQRPWCLYEYQVVLTPYRVASVPKASDLDHVIIALADSRTEDIIPHLPPPLAEQSWPKVDQIPALVDLVIERLSTMTVSLGTRLKDINDEALLNLRKGGAVPLPTKLRGIPGYLWELPTSQKEHFVGRTDELWHIFHLLQVQQLKGGFASCLLRGTGGVGKTQLAAEFVWRYGPNYYQGGLVWINAASDESSLKKQFLSIAKALAPGLEVKATVQDELVEAVKLRTNQAPVLRVVDNIPAPPKGSPPKSLEDWCPPLKYVTLLCTSRLSVIQATASVQINELSVKSATELLTQPEVQRSWLKNEDWNEIVRWVGCLPLALRILHASLNEHFITTEGLLARVRGEEPATALDREMEALQEIIPKEYLRGVAETLHVSYQSLVSDTKLQEAAHLLARMSPIPISESVIVNLISIRTLGRLASRGWLQLSKNGQGADRVSQWRMHRVIASYLRSISPDPGNELDLLASWLMDRYESDPLRTNVDIYLPHVLYAFRGIRTLLNEMPYQAAKCIENAKKLGLQLATWRLTDKRFWDVRFFAAEFIESMDYAGQLVPQLEKIYRVGDSSNSEGIAGMLSGLSNTPTAAQLCVEMLSDSSDQVRAEAMRQATRFSCGEAIAVPLLDALLEEISDPFCGAALGPSRKNLSLKADPFWDMPRSEAARSCLEVLGRSHNERIYGKLLSSLLEAQEGVAKLQAVNRLGLYLRTIETPLPLRIYSYGVFDSECQELVRQETSFQLPIQKQQSPGLYKPLINAILESRHLPTVESAVGAVTCTPSGLQALGTTADDMLANEKSQLQLIELSNKILSVSLHFLNANWYRAQAFAALGMMDEAITEYGIVIKGNPRFLEAYYLRASLSRNKGDTEGAQRDFEKMITINPDETNWFFWRGLAFEELAMLDNAIKDYGRVIRQDPEDVRARERRAMLLYEKGKFEWAMQDLDSMIELAPDYWWPYQLKSACLMELGKNEGAITASTSAIERNSDSASSWYLRGLARMRTGDKEKASKDMTRACKLQPENIEFQAMLDEIL